MILTSARCCMTSVLANDGGCLKEGVVCVKRNGLGSVSPGDLPRGSCIELGTGAVGAQQ